MKNILIGLVAFSSASAFGLVVKENFHCRSEKTGRVYELNYIKFTEIAIYDQLGNVLHVQGQLREDTSYLNTAPVSIVYTFTHESGITDATVIEQGKSITFNGFHDSASCVRP